MILRGILNPAAVTSIKKFDDKQWETYTLSNQSSYLDEDHHKDLNLKIENLNHEMAFNTEEKIEVVYDPKAVNYKQEILKIFRHTADPFGVEFGSSAIDYEQNPAEPNKPSKTVEINPFEPLLE